MQELWLCVVTFMDSVPSHFYYVRTAFMMGLFNPPAEFPRMKPAVKEFGF